MVLLLFTLSLSIYNTIYLFIISLFIHSIIIHLKYNIVINIIDVIFNIKFNYYLAFRVPDLNFF